MKRILIVLLSVSFLFSCNQSKDTHFLKDKSYREQVHKQFLERKELAAARADALFGVLEREDITAEQREALEFLYAYMPLSDLADYDGEFFLRQVNAAFEARETFDWGKKVPDAIFRHFVLVYRINNENLDTARLAFFDELKDRIQGMTMEEAVLEVNHWCHEKVSYRGTDGRTSAPLALVRTSWGRCGEESTFTATALRALGIPARQCYTPRWAHTDDNHAWVEVWVDGDWHYIGACEPEAELDLAWFTAPAKRAMMVHTNVFGVYKGPEEKNLEEELYSKINLTSNYAETRKLEVRVEDAEGNPVEGAKLRFKLYNYAQLYPIAEGITNQEGQASVLTGMGDLVVWASKDDRFGYAEAVSTDKDVVIIKLNHQPGDAYDEAMTLVPPVEQKIKEIAADKQAENARRFITEDSIRNAYMATFMTEEKANELAAEWKLDKARVWKYLQLAQGNWRAISAFMEKEKENIFLFPFLASLSEKDLRDTPAEYLMDFLNERTVFCNKGESYANDREFIAKYILSPRIGIELIRPWQSYFSSQFGDSKDRNATGVIEWIKANVTIKDSENYYYCPISPIGVHSLKVSDIASRDIFFVALCRFYRIPARLEPATGKPQYFNNNQWVDAVFETTGKDKQAPQAALTFTNNKENRIKPQYEMHYTLARFTNGDFEPLDYWDNPALKNYPATVSINAGYYRLMIGTRANDGSVTTYTEYFNLKEGEKKTLDIKLPTVEGGKLQVMGIVDMNTIIQLQNGTKTTLKDLSQGKGVVLCFVDPDREPSKHVLQDLPALRKELEDWGGGIVFMTPDDKLSVAFDASVFKGLPEQNVWAVDPSRTLLNTVSNTLQLGFRNNFPLTLLLTNNGGVVFFSEGYRIGIGENIIKTIRN